MVDDPGQLLRVQSGVEGVQHTPCAADAKVQFQVPIAIPGQCGHTAAWFQAQPIQRMGHFFGTRGNVFPGVAVQIALYPAGNNFAIGVVALRMFDQR